jgi:signal transduction histidine kinase
VTAGDRLPTLHTDRGALRLILENLIGNAIIHHDRTEGRVTVAAKLAGGAVEIRVSDDGPGIAPQFHDRIFTVFQTLAGRDELESSGVGLAIVKKLVESHGGRVWVESAPRERGASFIFTWWQEAA